MNDVKEEIRSTYFDESQHLSSETIALCAEAMINRKFLTDIPEEVSLHVQECESCSNKLLSFAEDVEDNPVLLKQIQNKGNELQANSFNRLKAIYFSAAAAVLLIVILSINIFYPSQSLDELFIAEFKPYPNIITTKSSAKTQLTEAMLQYDLKDYNPTIEILSQVIQKDTTNNKAFFYLGVSYLSVGKTKHAIINLKKVSTSNDLLKDQSIWYMALSYLRLGEKEKSKELLEQLVSNRSDISKKAKTLLKKLRRIR